MSGNSENCMIADTCYKVMHAVNIGDRNILVAENMADPEGQHYVKAEYSHNDIIGQYDRVVYSPDYLSAMDEFSSSIGRQVAGLRDDYERADFQIEMFTSEHCYPHDYGDDITGEVVAIKASALRPEYRRGDAQLVFVTHGGGARANPRSSAVFCYHLNNGEKARYERHQVQGRIKDTPQWVKSQLEYFQALREIGASERIAPDTVRSEAAAGRSRAEGARPRLHDRSRVR